MTPIEERFQAAVNVIRGLPKNGSYQPSNDMMLKFYSYFKQGTIGPCNQKKPPFWDLVSKAKYDSWKALGNMPKENAMENYVDELKKIIETMSYTDNVANFMGSIHELDGINVDDLEAVAPEAIKKVRSHPNSPFASRESSPMRVPLANHAEPAIDNLVNGHNGVYLNGGGGGDYGSHNGSTSSSLQNGHVEQSDDEYIDTVDDDEHLAFRHRNGGIVHNSRSKYRNSHVNGVTDTAAIKHDYVQIINTLMQINVTVQKMNSDITNLTKRMENLEILHTRESSLGNLAATLNTAVKRKSKYPSWWPFEDISPNWFVVMFVWPFVAQKIMSSLTGRRRPKV